MRGPTVRKLCTLSALFRSHVQNNPQKNPSSIITSIPSPPVKKLGCEGVDDHKKEKSLSEITVKKLGCEGVDDHKKEKSVSETTAILDSLNVDASIRWKAVGREMKQKWICGDKQSDSLTNICAKKLGTTATVGFSTNSVTKILGSEINKYYEELKQSGIRPTKQIFMTLITRYAACGKLEKAKQLLLDPRIELKYLNEIKSVLVSVLASHGQLSEALVIYEEIKKAGHDLEPKAAIRLIKKLRHKSGELDGLLLLLKELSDLDYWVDGCYTVILYCAENNHLSTAVDLFKQLKDHFKNDEIMTEVLFDGVYSVIVGSESTHLQFGMDLLWAIKDELGLVPSRQCLDFLLTACAQSKDLNNTCLVWREYEVCGYLYNVLSYVRMYQALLASGDHISAQVILKKIERDDAEICSLILECQKTYSVKIKSVEREKKKKNVTSVEGGRRKRKQQKRKKIE